MKHPTKADSFDAHRSGAIPEAAAKRPIRKRSKKPGRNKKKLTEGKSGIRETEEARALLQDQLHSLYWWVFSACKMKGFIRAKDLDELQRSTAAGNDAHTEQGDFADDQASPQSKRPKK